MSAWQAIIGLEVHAQLRTISKMFCPCPVPGDARPTTSEPNTSVCPICLGHPGTLPLPNVQAVRLGVRAALALGATVHVESVFSRKHYFYPDLPKGYQITQAERPLATGGAIHVGGRPIAIERLHLEEDAGKSFHDPSGTAVDWNRAGVPLAEIVGAPELRTPEEAEVYLRLLHRVLVEAGVCIGDLEQGHFRCDANVSIVRPGHPAGARVEVKNVNSFRFVRQALRYEIERQIALADAGAPTDSETRTWSGDRTHLLRRKEDREDYRYLDDPDLQPLILDSAWVAEERSALPGVPMDRVLLAADASRRAEWEARYAIAGGEVDVLLAEPEIARFFEATVAAGAEPLPASAWVRTEVLRIRNAGGLGALVPAHLARVIAGVTEGSFGREDARALLETLANDGGDADALAAARGLTVVRDEGLLARTIEELITRFPDEYLRWRSGHAAVFGFFMGKLMAATGRRADPQVAARLLRAALDADR